MDGRCERPLNSGESSSGESSYGESSYGESSYDESSVAEDARLQMEYGWMEGASGC